jgi:hypothetical protein
MLEFKTLLEIRNEKKQFLVKMQLCLGINLFSKEKQQLHVLFLKHIEFKKLEYFIKRKWHKQA